MSYNGYNYPPYYQSAGNDARGTADTYQSTAGANGGRYQTSSYGSSNTHSAQQSQPSYVSQQQPSSYTPTTTAADRPVVSYSRYGDSSSTSPYQDMRGGYGYTGQSAVGTSPLGNLAHASSLEQDSRNGGRDNRSLQQIIDYNRSQNRHGNNVSPVYGTAYTNASYDHQQSDSRGAQSSGVSYSRDWARESAGADRPTPTPKHSSQFTTNAGYNHSVAAYAATQNYPETTSASHSSYKAPTSQEQRPSTYYAQPAPTGSGQSHHARSSDSQSNHQVASSPTYPANQAPSTDSTSYAPQRQNSATTYRSEQIPSSQHRQHADRRSPGSPAQVVGNRPSLPAPGAPVSNRQSTRPRADNGTIGQQSAQAPAPPAEQALMTVDPSHVFNHQEYQRRQAEAAAAKAAVEAERAQKVSQAEESRKATEAATALRRVSEGHSNSAGHSNGAASSEPTKEEQMAVEMRQMIEKMRDYKSKDPSLFSQIWEQVKKVQPPGSVPAAPPLSAKDIPLGINQQGQAGRANGMSSLSPAPNQGADGELPDLGRFPAQRRRRGGKTDSPAKKRKSKGESTAADGSPPRVNGSRTSPPVDPAIIEASIRSQQNVQASRAIPTVTTHSRGPNHQVVYVSGTGPQVPHQADSSNPPTDPSSSSQPARAAAPAFVPPPAPIPPTGKTAWPEHKKWDLAVAAKNILLAMPVNAAKAKSISPEQILAYLNENPSYEKLCQMIESKGLIIERGHFARSLLEAVPGMGGGMQRSAFPNGSTPQPHGPDSGTPPSKKLRFAYHTIPPKNVPTSVAPTAQMTAGPLPAPAVLQLSTAPEELTVPLTKQQQARKRNILEIVDLSQLSDDDTPPPPPPKVQRLDNLPNNLQPPALNGNIHQFNAVPQPAITPQLVNGLPPYYRIPATHSPAPHAHPQYPYPPPHSTPMPPAPTALSFSASAGQRELANSEDVVQPIDEGKAIRRKGYNPKTIVRDVLVAAGRHPTMQPLNYHLDGLRKTFKHVNDISDLSTLRWDLIDPGDPLPAPVAGPRQEVDVDGDEGDDPDKGEEILTHSRPASGTQVVAANGVEPAAVTTASAPQIIPHPPKLLGPQRKRGSHLNDKSKSWIGNVSPKTPQPASSGVATPTTESSTVKRRGRPPGAKNKQPRKDKGSPSQSRNVPSQSTTDTTPVRPSGLRNSVASGNGVAVVVLSASPSVVDIGKPRRGRPRKSSPRFMASQKMSQQSSPIHRVYKCDWENCPAELHNPETLRKHANKHGDKYKEEGGPFPCLWKGCGRPARVHKEANEGEGDKGDREAEHQPLRFGTHDIWVKHMDKRHISAYAWQFGDGPLIRSYSSEVPGYVSESATRQVTPLTTHDGPPDPLPLSADKETAKVYHRAHGNVSELDKAQAFLEASERRRQEFGPGMDRPGATFVTREMNTLLDDSMGPLQKVGS